MDHMIILYIGCSLALLAIGVFLWKFLLPAFKVKRTLKAALLKLREAQADGQHFTNLRSISDDVMTAESLAHAWDEFKDTLHAEKGEIDEFGGVHPGRYRQTVPAEVFFSGDALVHSPMNSEFFRHFPGVLTATGIVLTFGGLIIGLSNFGMTVDVDAVNSQVDGLIDTVGHTFIVSALMIFLAVVATACEKFLINSNLKLQHEICVELDKMFDAGVGEEYLQRLVTSSEDSASSAAKLKDQLVEKLEELLDIQTEKTTSAISAQSQMVSDAVQRSITDTFREPLAQMTRAVENQAQGAAEGTGKVLEHLISEFTAKIDDTFGQQMRGLNEMMEANSNALRNTSAAIGSLSDDLGAAGRQATAAMGEHVKEVVGGLATTQAEFQSETHRTLEAIQDELKAMAASNTQVIDGVSASVESMQNTTAQTTSQLTEGAASIAESVSAIEAATQGMGDLTTSFSGTLERLHATTGSLSESTANASAAAQKYLEASRSATEFLRQAEEVLALAQRDTEADQIIIERIEAAAERINDASRNLDQYLESVDTALIATHKTFASQLGTTLNASNSAFQKHLSDATALLSGAIKELGEVVEEIPQANAQV